MRIDPITAGSVAGELAAGPGRGSGRRAYRGRGLAQPIRNAEGASLYDLRDELHAAARDAIASSGSTKAPVAVQDAIDRVLEENGFDVAEVRDALRGRGRAKGMERRIAADASLPGPASGVPDQAEELRDVSTSALEPPELAPGPAEMLVQSLLADLRPGSLVSVYA